MPILHKLSYKRLGDIYAEISIDDKPLKCSRFSFEHELNSVPYAEVEVYSNADIDALADIGLRVYIKDLDSAIRCLKMAYQLDNGFKEQAADYIRKSLGEEVDAWDIAKRLLTDDNT